MQSMPSSPKLGGAGGRVAGVALADEHVQLQALVALAGATASPAGAAAVVSSGGIASVVRAIAAQGQSRAAVAIAGSRILEHTLAPPDASPGSGVARGPMLSRAVADLNAHAGVATLVVLLGSARATTDADVALHAASALLAALTAESGGEAARAASSAGASVALGRLLAVYDDADTRGDSPDAVDADDAAAAAAEAQALCQVLRRAEACILSAS
jgi:hypothetical protein